jgi:hypothetical protein
MEKINLVKLLENCPTGMELDCTMYNKVTLSYVYDSGPYPIKIQTPDGIASLDKYGCYSSNKHAKCVIFPKGKTTWEGFVPPCKFKDGDIISDGNYVAIFYKIGTPCCYPSSSTAYYHCYYSQKYCKFKKELDFGIGTFTEFKYATEEEKQKLFDAIKANGYNWNEETKTLEKLVKPKFKVGDKVKDKNNRVWFVVQVSEKHFDISSVPNAEGYFVPIDDQDNYELVPNKFDITTLKPFDKVLVRDNNEQKWTIDYFSFVDKEQVYPFVCVGHYVSQCIPYENNEHLLGTTNNCDEYFKIWE